MPAVGVLDGAGEADAVGEATLWLALPFFQSVATNKTIGDTNVSSRVSFATPISLAKAWAAAKFSDLSRISEERHSP